MRYRPRGVAPAPMTGEFEHLPATSPHDFLVNLALVLGLAALIAAAFRALRLPVIVGYLVAGLAVGPHTPLPLLVDRAIVETLSELGVILLMFCLGIEFSARKLIAVAPHAGPTNAVEMSLTGWLGYVAASLLGWSPLECVFAAAVVAISSTMVIVKTFDDQRTVGRFTEVVFGVLIFQDLAAIVALTALTAVASGQGASADVLLQTLLHLGLFLAGLAVVAVPIIPRLVRAIARLESDETTLVFSVGLCFALALLASEAGFSVALGAFAAGSLVAESGEAHRIEALVVPLRDVFAAVFFVSVGMLIEPWSIVDNLPAVALFTAVVMVGKLVGVTTGSLLAGNPVRRSVRAAMSLTQVGEFSFIIAGIGVAHEAVPPSLLAIAVAVSVITTLTTPWMVRSSDRVARAVDHSLPRRVATLFTLYGTWLEQLRRGSRTGTAWREIRVLARWLIIDAACLWAIALGADVATARLDTGPVAIVAFVLGIPFIVGLVRNTVRLAAALAAEALPLVARDHVDFASAPRGAFTVALETAVLTVVGLPLIAFAQPLVPAWALAPLLVAFAAAVALLLWRGTRNLQGHVHAGATVVLEALVRSLPKPDDEPPSRLQEAERLLPGLGNVVPLRVPEGAWAAGRTLGEIDVHCWCGATAVALQRQGGGLSNPGSDERLEVGDVLVVLGTTEATEATRTLLLEGPS